MTTNNAINIDQAGVTYYDGSGTFTGFPLADGELVIGSSIGAPAAAPITAGSNIVVANGPNSIIISAIGGGGSGLQVINRQVFPTAGTFVYTPTPGMIFCDIEVCGGGAGGNFAAGTGVLAGGGGGAGGYARGIFTASEIGASQTVVIGAGGAGGPILNTFGTPGGDTSVGSLISSTGGQVSTFSAGGGIGGTGTGGDYQLSGTQGGSGFVTGTAYSGSGGASYFGGAGIARLYPQTVWPISAVSYGSGGAGTTSVTAPSPAGDGFQGIVIITEYIGTGATIQKITYLTVASSPHVVQTSDVFFSVDSSGGPVTLQFPDVPQPGQQWTVKDATGSSSINPITLTSMSGSVLFDGSTSYVINTDYSATSLIGTNVPTYEIY